MSRMTKRNFTSRPQRHTSGGYTLDFQALLGMEVLRQLHLYVAYKEHKLYVTSASAH